VRPGDPVAIKLAPYTYLEHGYVEGHLRLISATPSHVGGSQRRAGAALLQGYVDLDRIRLRDVPKDFKLLQGRR